ncbi:hypothetical protein Glove_470g24 [Diversispora epigaea]|uniref:Uncharacterized protein n=1 Tax=Diversispora epigaea TaxID=1348612 RepID=A0A397GML8_9GLOM|nr:hypothetical protein Glove_470g24 [Diversispora epigaea]
MSNNKTDEGYNKFIKEYGLRENWYNENWNERLRSNATRLSSEVISDIITAKGTTNTLPNLAKKYNVSYVRICKIWEFAINN